MTPLAQRVARELTLPKMRRSIIDGANVLSLINQDMHCFDVSMLHDPILEAMEEETPDALWESIASMLPTTFLPSPVTWLEMAVEHKSRRLAFVLKNDDNGFSIDIVTDEPEGPLSTRLCRFEGRGVLDAGGLGISVEILGDPVDKNVDLTRKPSVPFNLTPYDLEDLKASGDAKRINLIRGALEAKRNKAYADLQKTLSEEVRLKTKLAFSEEIHMRHAISTVVMMLDLINTPGLVGLKQHDPHRGLAKELGRSFGVNGSYPLRSWSEVVVKTHTVIAGEGGKQSGSTFRKCLHFVRSHRRHYRRDGRTVVIPAHWRGDPALGMKRTRYVVQP